MAGPEVLATIGIASTVGGGLADAFGGIFGGNAASSKFKYQAGMSRMNAMINRQNAEYETVIGEREAGRAGMKSAFTTSNIRSGQAASGGVVDTGSNADVVESQHAIGLMDQQTIRNSAAQRAYGYEIKAAEDESSAKMFEIGARNARTAGYLSAAKSILGAGGSVASKWLTAKQHGLYSEDGSSGGEGYGEAF